jgi:hypothetical protein
MAALQLDQSKLALKALRMADFDPVARVQSVWDDSIGLSQDLHQKRRDDILSSFFEAAELEFDEPAHAPKNPLIEVFTGIAGAGKTQLLGQIRTHVIAAGHQFVLVDMTGVNSFYSTVCLELIKSLQQKTPTGNSQLELVLACLFQFVERTASEDEAVRKLRTAANPPNDFDDLADTLTSEFSLRFASQPLAMKIDSRKHVLRALMMLGLLVGDERFDAAYDWLQGGELDEPQAALLKLPRKASPSDIIRATTWFMSFRAPTLLAFDQLDVMVNQFETASRGGNSETAAAAQATVIEIAGGLASLWEQVYRSEILISCLQQTFDTLKGNILASVMDRFCAIPVTLGDIVRQETGMQIVELRLAAAYQKAGFAPPYPTWPFHQSFFEVGQSPRSLLQKCFAHRKKCQEAGQVFETAEVIPASKPATSAETHAGPLQKLDDAFAQAKATVNTAGMDAGTDEADEAIGKLIVQACELLLLETPPGESVHAKLDLASRAASKNKIGLHSRLRLIFMNENDREEFFCFRCLQLPNATAFQGRLRAAITDSGVNLKLPFRRLVVVRNQSLPSGPKTKLLVDELLKHGGRILPLPAAELHHIAALRALFDQKDPLFPEWLSSRKPLATLNFIRDAFHDYFALVKPEAPSTASVPVAPLPPLKTEPVRLTATPPSSASILLGNLVGALNARPIEMPISNFTRHVLIRAGAGSGKTVLLKRLIESAAVLGVPSIVLDPGNDLAFLGDAWPQTPTNWLQGDSDRASAYHKQVDVVVWTPGRNAGRPLGFSPLPDFSAVLNDPDDFNSAVDMAVGSLSDATGASANKIKKGVLTGAIQHFARVGGHTLPELINFLRDLPFEAQNGISKASKQAQDMADMLQATVLSSKILMPESGGTDIAELLGLGQPKTRVSVVSLAGLSETNGDRLAFVNQLAVVLFTWIRKNPATAAGQVRGLLVVDEAKDFIPSVKSTPCKESLMRVAAQARKYGFGLMLATQNPTDIDHKAAGQCATQFFGRAASPNVINAMREAIEQRGGNAPDLTRLGKGQFYFFSSESQTHPERIQVPLCLSYHPDGQTLTQTEIEARARKAISARA